jgi:putative tryptophan/tyrosine transport system substrate-binding protein
MRRREFIVGLGGAAAWPLRAQQAERLRRSGVLMGPDENNPVAKTYSLRSRKRTWGWTDGRNVRMDLRWGGNDTNRIRALAQALVGLQPDIIVTTAPPPTVALQRGTRTIPIVFTSVGDPVASGIVARLDRPIGNITGFSLYEPSLGRKWLQLLSEIAPPPAADLGEVANPGVIRPAGGLLCFLLRFSTLQSGLFLYFFFSA